MKKKRLIKRITIIGLIAIAFFSMFPIMNIIYNSNSDHIIKIAILQDESLKTHYIEVNPNGTITYWIGSRDSSHPDKIDMSRLFLSKSLSIFGRQSVRLSKDEINDIFNSADDLIVQGSFFDGIVYGGYFCEFHYNGVTQRIYYASESRNADLYWLIHRIATSLPKSIGFEDMVFFDDGLD